MVSVASGVSVSTVRKSPFIIFQEDIVVLYYLDHYDHNKEMN